MDDLDWHIYDPSLTMKIETLVASPLVLKLAHPYKLAWWDFMTKLHKSTSSKMSLIQLVTKNYVNIFRIFKWTTPFKALFKIKFKSNGWSGLTHYDPSLTMKIVASPLVLKLAHPYKLAWWDFITKLHKSIPSKMNYIQEIWNTRRLATHAEISPSLQISMMGFYEKIT